MYYHLYLLFIEGQKKDSKYLALEPDAPKIFWLSSRIPLGYIFKCFPGHFLT